MVQWGHAALADGLAIHKSPIRAEVVQLVSTSSIPAHTALFAADCVDVEADSAANLSPQRDASFWPHELRPSSVTTRRLTNRNQPSHAL